MRLWGKGLGAIGQEAGGYWTRELDLFVKGLGFVGRGTGVFEQRTGVYSTRDWGLLDKGFGGSLGNGIWGLLGNGLGVIGHWAGVYWARVWGVFDNGMCQMFFKCQYFPHQKLGRKDKWIPGTSRVTGNRPDLAVLAPKYHRLGLAPRPGRHARVIAHLTDQLWRLVHLELRFFNFPCDKF